MFIYAFVLAVIRREFPRDAKLCNSVTKCVTLTNLAKTPKKIDIYFLFAKSNLRENSFMHLRHFLTLLLFIFMKK